MKINELLGFILFFLICLTIPSKILAQDYQTITENNGQQAQGDNPKGVIPSEQKENQNNSDLNEPEIDGLGGLKWLTPLSVFQKKYPSGRMKRGILCIFDRDFYGTKASRKYYFDEKDRFIGFSISSSSEVIKHLINKIENDYGKPKVEQADSNKRYNEIYIWQFKKAKVVAVLGNKNRGNLHGSYLKDFPTYGCQSAKECYKLGQKQLRLNEHREGDKIVWEVNYAGAILLMQRAARLGHEGAKEFLRDLHQTKYPEWNWLLDWENLPTDSVEMYEKAVK
ncbi:MAG: hypothetical protein JW882_15140 [Deltaproteobacteria bacterium]|nr:hypothetical protein [Deltaproteobacteria bacterium]